jgi:hypothetical protein
MRSTGLTGVIGLTIHNATRYLSVIKISCRRFLGADKSEFRHPVRSLDT